MIGLSTTNNLVEVWHCASSSDAEINLTTIKTVTLLRKAKRLTEQTFVKATMCEIVYRKSTKAKTRKH